MHTNTMSELLALIEGGKVSCVEVAQHFIDRIARYNVKLNAVISVDEENALRRAKDFDNQKSQSSPLKGIPILHKDIFCTQGMKTSCASKMLDNFFPPYDATVVAKLNQAGVNVLGKANMDEFAMGSSNETSFYGWCANPWDKTRVAGGSSGGSASAVAAGLVPAATGSDTGGSIRQPAAFCGVSGIKPTYGRISRYGMIAFASSLDQAGPIAKSAQDLALLLTHMSGYDAKDSTSDKRCTENYSQTLAHSIRGKRIGLPRQFFDQDLNPEILSKLEAMLDVYRDMGASVVDIDLEALKFSIPCYYVISSAECSSNLSRFDGIRFGYQCDNPLDLQDLYERTRQEGFGDEVKRRILIGTYTLSSGYYDAYYHKAQKIRRLIKQDFCKAFENVDVIVGPTTPDVAFQGGSKKAPLSMYLSDIYTTAVNLAGLPALSMPVGFVNDLPVGAQLIGNYFDEKGILNFSHQYQLQTHWHKQMPDAYQ